MARINTRVRPVVTVRNVWSEDRGKSQLVVLKFADGHKTRLQMSPDEALTIAGDLVLVAAQLGAHARAVSELTDLADELSKPLRPCQPGARSA